MDNQGITNELEIGAGELVSYQGDNYVIKQLTGKMQTVILEGTINGKLITARIRDLMHPILETAEEIQPVVPLESFSDEQWAEAQRRFAIIRPLLEGRTSEKLVQKICKAKKVSRATIFRWLKNYNSTGTMSSLVPEKSSGGKNKGRLDESTEAIIKVAIEEIYMTTQRSPLKKVALEIIRRCKNVGIKTPSINTIRNRIFAISEEQRLRARMGKKAADDKFKPTVGHFPNVTFPLSVVQIDHTSLDIILVDEIHRLPIGRPWITLAIDIYSRMVVGLYISFDPPGMLGTGMCIANSILPKEQWLDNLRIDGEWPCWGRMNTIHLDNAKEFRGAMLANACMEYDIAIQWRPVKTPNWGGHIERLLGTLLQEIHDLPGTTFSNPKQRGQYDSEAKAALTLKDFETWLVTYIVNIYHRRIHTTLGKTPLQAFEDGIYKRGLPPRILNDFKIKLDFLPYVERSIQEYGIVIDHIHYYGDVMRKWIHALENSSTKSMVKRKFMFKRDPRDISIIYFYDPEAKEYYPIPYRDSSRPPMTLWEHKEVMAHFQKQGRSEVDENMIFEAYNHLKKIETEAVTKTQQAKRRKKIARVGHSKEKSIKNIHSVSDMEYSSVTQDQPRIDFKNIKIGRAHV